MGWQSISKKLEAPPLSNYILLRKFEINPTGEPGKISTDTMEKFLKSNFYIFP
jgi:hypothetical protein